MLSDSDESLESNSSRSSITNSEAESFDSGEEFQLDIGDEPYQDEPLASDGGESDDDEETDIDGLTPATLEARFEKRIPVQEWCKCSHCNEENLQDALEFRCCHEITNAIGKLVFDGSIERVSCITQHEDYEALINKTVLLQVAPLLRDQNGRGYRRQNGASENEFLRAVAYRWVIRWICGFMGWDNRRPLPACVYHSVRLKYSSNQRRGYAAAADDME